MKRVTRRLAFVVVMSLWAQTAAKRIQVTAGAPPVTLEGEVVKGKDATYVFQAKAGMKFNGRFTQKAGNTGFGITDPDGLGLPEEEFDFNSSFTGTLPKTGDYTISVTTFETKRSRYVLLARVYQGG